MITIGDKDVSAQIYVSSDGVVEVGKYLDFHDTDEETPSDYTCRIQDMNADKTRTINLPSHGGTMATLEDTVSKSVLDKDRGRRKVVSLRGEGFDEDHWYPCDFDADPNTTTFPLHLIIHNTLNTDSQGDAKPSWGTNSGGFALYVDMEIGGSGWGQINIYQKLNAYFGEWGGDTAVGSIHHVYQLSKFIIYLRGGANYYYTCDCESINIVAHNSTYTVAWGDNNDLQSFDVQSTQGNIKEWFDFDINDCLYSARNFGLVNTNEFNFTAPNIESIWINYRTRLGSNDGNVLDYKLGNGTASESGYAGLYAAAFYRESDIRLKSDIKPLEHTLQQICDIPTVEFNMYDKHQIGTIAQNLEEHFPEIVKTDKDGIKAVQYDMLGVVAIEGIKLLKQEIEDLKKQVEELKNGMCNSGNDIQ